MNRGKIQTRDLSSGVESRRPDSRIIALVSDDGVQDFFLHLTRTRFRAADKGSESFADSKTALVLPEERRDEAGETEKNKTWR